MHKSISPCHVKTNIWFTYFLINIIKAIGKKVHHLSGSALIYTINTDVSRYDLITHIKKLLDYMSSNISSSASY